MLIPFAAAIGCGAADHREKRPFNEKSSRPSKQQHWSAFDRTFVIAIPFKK
jgi:hypothetical protein